MKAHSIPFILMLCFMNCTQSNPTIPLYIGTYTDGDSEGIYRLQFNTETGELSDMQLAAKSSNPSYITFSPDRANLYVVNENDPGEVSSYKLNTDGSLDFINSVSSEGAAPCHISVNKTGDIAAVSNYTSGTVSLYNINENGGLNDAYQVFNHNVPDSISHAHSAQFFEDNLYVSDLGRNAVYNYRLSSNKKDYELITSSIIPMHENVGPRHFALTNDGQFIYIIDEYGNAITSAKKVNDKFQSLEHVSTLRDDFKGDSNCADIHLSKDESFVYGSNRGENTIVVFKRNKETGTLEKIQNEDVHGNWPRNFTLDPTGKFLLVANKKSNNISVFKIDQETGKLTFLNSTDLPTPVCLLF